MSIFYALAGRKRVLVKENQRLVALHLGHVLGIFGPGEHRLPNKRFSLEVVFHDLSTPAFVSPYEKAIFDNLPKAAAKHLVMIRTAGSEICVVERDGAVYQVLGPDQKIVVWADAGPWSEIRFAVPSPTMMDHALALRLIKARKNELMTSQIVQEGQAGLMFVDGTFERVLPPGMHNFWVTGQQVQVKIIDLKWQPLDVSGQELLTRDKVTIRVNLSSQYRVVDPVLAFKSVKDFSDLLYRSLQFAFRSALGTMTLDQILERKVALGIEATEKLKADMALIGIEVGNIELKDVILPGEMRDILNQVVAAEKQAEANVIRRREETNATRSLLNTAKVMAENPVMLRLKELEALETISGKVQHLTIHNGTGGLLNDLVKLRDT